MLKCIFSINPGRSGSHYLSLLLSAVKNVIPFHEAPPRMQDVPLILWNQGDQKPLRDLFLKEKLPKIQEVVEKGFIYSETNNAFVKGFGYLVMEHFRQEETAVIILRRKRQEIVRSLLDVGCLPHKEDPEDSWMLHPDAPTNLLRPSGNSDVELCQWYVAEVYARGENFQKTFPKVRYVDLNLEDLNELTYVRSIVERLGLDPLDRIVDIVGKPTNTRELYLSPRQSSEAEALRVRKGAC